MFTYSLYYREQTDGYRGEAGGGWVKYVMGIKECPFCNEHQVLYASVESLYCIPEINITLYVN